MELTNGVVALCRGRGGQIRGLNVGFTRPDCIIVDDVEDEESVSTEEQMGKAKSMVLQSASAGAAANEWGGEDCGYWNAAPSASAPHEPGEKSRVVRSGVWSPRSRRGADRAILYDRGAVSGEETFICAYWHAHNVRDGVWK